MDCYITLRPWTPRTQRHDAIEPSEPETPGVCARTVAILKPIILDAIRPFPEAHRAMSLALASFLFPEKATSPPVV